MATTSVYCSPLTSDPSLVVSANSFPRSFEVELADGLYNLCPWQDSPQAVEGMNRSLLPVSKATVSNTASDSNIYTDDKVIPVKVFWGVPTEMVPYQKLASSSVNGIVPSVPRLVDVLIPLERGCGVPVFF
jgi:hypothetical protein